MVNEVLAKLNLAAELKVHRLYTKSSLFESANIAPTELGAAQSIVSLLNTMVFCFGECNFSKPVVVR